MTRLQTCHPECERHVFEKYFGRNLETILESIGGYTWGRPGMKDPFPLQAGLYTSKVVCNKQNNYRVSNEMDTNIIDFTNCTVYK